MELVDANTKNFVYMTLSQFNDTQQLKRTRVSMRRDQPFWQGGNSFICCESFRVTASPNPGGLYYKVFPADWFMGCQIAHDAPSAVPANASFEDLEIKTGNEANLQTYQMGKALAAIRVTAVAGDNGPGAEGEFFLQSLKAIPAGQTVAPRDHFYSNDPTVIETFLRRFVNHYYMTTGAWCRLALSAGAVPGEAWIEGRLLENPGRAITGNGIGPTKMYYPDLKLGSAQQVQVLSDLAVAAAAQSTDVPINLTLSQEDPRGGVVSDDALKLTLDNLGSGLHVQNRTKGGPVGSDWGQLIMGGVFEVYGVHGVVYNFQTRFFSGPNDVSTKTNEGGVPRYYPMHWARLAPGESCWCFVPAGDANGIPEGTYYGRFVSVPEQYEGEFNLDMKINDNTLAFASNTGGPDLLVWADQRFMFTTDAKRVSEAITAPFSFMDGVEHNMNAAIYAAMHTAKVQYSTAQTEGAQRICIRSPSIDEPRYMYTPNEMLYFFNKPEPDHGDLAYKLQTDENGGFVVWWNEKKENPGTNFVISVGLSEELGLNPYFEYTVSGWADVTSVTEFYVLKRQRTPEDTEVSDSLWMDKSLLSSTQYPGTWTPAVPQPQQAVATGLDATLWDRDGNSYFYIDSHVTHNQSMVTRNEYIYPQLISYNGVDCYQYTNLPLAGKIGNTQCVSVESFSTYSEITIVIPNLPFQSMLGTNSDERILASLRLPFQNTTSNDSNGKVNTTGFSYYGDLIFNTLASRSYLKVTTDQQLYDCDVEVRLIRRDGEMDVMQLPYRGEFQVKLRLLQTQ